MSMEHIQAIDCSQNVYHCLLTQICGEILWPVTNTFGVYHILCGQ